MVTPSRPGDGTYYKRIKPLPIPYAAAPRQTQHQTHTTRHASRSAKHMHDTAESLDPSPRTRYN